MKLHYLMLLASICLSCVAAYYSIVGMTSIFNGAIFPIILMTGILEVSKLIVSSWLYNNWLTTNNILKTYLTSAVVILMFITNIGIFGFLSKANIEQSAMAEEQLAQITHVDQQIAEQRIIISDIKSQMAAQVDSTGDSAINARIADANRVIDSINKRAQTLVDEQRQIINQEQSKFDQRVSVYQKQLDDLDHQVSIMTAHQQKQIFNQINRQKIELSKKIEALRNAPDTIIDSANAEINKIRSTADGQTHQAQTTVNDLTSKLTQGVDIEKSQTDIDQKNIRIKTASDQIDALNATKFKMESESRKLDVEFGPIKFIAQMIYGDNVDQKLLEHAVRLVILILILVFDPLALAMLIAANQGINSYKKQEDTPEELKNIESIDNEIVGDTINQELTNDIEPVNVTVNEQPEEIVHTLSDTVDYESTVVIQSTVDLLAALQKAHDLRSKKSN